MRSHVNTALWDAETRKEHTEWLLPFFDSIAAYFSRKHPNYTPYLGGFSRKHPNYTLYLGGFGCREAASHPFLKADATTSYCIGFGNEGKRGDRYLLQAVDIVLRHLGTAFAIHTRRNDATGIACSFATREKPS